MIDFFKVVRTRLGSRARVLLANLRGQGAEGADEDAEPVEDAEVAQPLGLFARPILRATLEAIATRLGDEVVVFFLQDKGAGVLSDVEEGETRLYATADASCRLRLRADGAADLESKSGQDVRVNGGTLKVARVTDAVRVGTLQFNPGSSGATLSWVPPGGGPPQAVTLPGLVITGDVDPGAGAEHFKA